MQSFKQWRIETKAYFFILTSDTLKLIISLIFPLAAAAAIVAIAGKNMFVNCDDTKTGCFFITCAAIWGGLFNSIQIIASERANIKREMINGLKPRCYTASRTVLQLVLCALQSLLLTSCFFGIKWVHHHSVPKDGVIFGHTMLEYYISVFLLMFATDMMGMLISSLVKSVEAGTALAPYILIAQLIFSGVFLSLKGVFKKISAVMLSRWGMEALGSTSNLNKLPLKIVKENKDIEALIEHEAESMFRHTQAHLLRVWLILIGFSLLFILAANLAVHRIKRDSR